MTTVNSFQCIRRSYQAMILLLAVLIVNVCVANAQAPGASNSPANPPNSGSNTGTAAQGETPNPQPAPTPNPLSVKTIKVNGETAGLSDKITVVVANLAREIARQQDPKAGVPAQERLDPYKYVLFLNGIEMKKLYPVSVTMNSAGDGELQYELRRDADTRNAWLNFLAHPRASTMPVTASVGLEGKPPYEGQSFTLRLYNRRLLYVGVALFLTALIGFFVAAKYTPIIRDSGPPKPVNGILTRPYSLGRAQMAWWFFIILGSFLFIALVTWDLDTITSSSLVLLGIGTGTALGAAMVDANKRESSTNELSTLAPQEAKLTALLADLDSKITGIETALAANPAQPDLSASLSALRTERATREAERQQVKSQLEDALSAQQKPESEGLFVDLLSDVNGVTFHRFQILVWTITLGFVFIYSVWRNLAMPQFSDTILALMGISAGTYIGFKIPEKQTKAEEVAGQTGAGAAVRNAVGG